MSSMSTLFSVAISLSLLACATGSQMIDHDRAASGTRAHLDLGVAPDGSSAFPSAIEPTLPSVDRIGMQVRAALGDTARANVHLCVSPAGSVTKVELVTSSTFAAFDEALLRDAKSWQFASMPGPSSVQTCSNATVSYHPYY